jgi:hypothetical protein
MLGSVPGARTKKSRTHSEVLITIKPTITTKLHRFGYNTMRRMLRGNHRLCATPQEWELGATENQRSLPSVLKNEESPKKRSYLYTMV